MPRKHPLAAPLGVGGAASTARQQLHQSGRDLLAALPNIAPGLLLAGFVLLARGVRAGVRRVLRKPLPTRQLLLHNQTEATDANRQPQHAGWPTGQGDVPQPVRRCPRPARLNIKFAQGEAAKG